MSDNPPIALHRVFALPDHGVIELSGPDATRFAQAQFMNDVAALGDGQWQWSGWLTPKGRVVAVFALLRVAEDRLLMVVPDAPVDALAASLARFVFRSKVRVTEAPLAVAGTFERDGAGDTTREPDEGFTLDVGTPDSPRLLVLSGAAAPQDELAMARWRVADLEHGLPRLAEDQREHWTPQQLSLDRLGAFSVKKGCYPGQEIVARTHFLGKAKRGLALFDAASACSPGDAVAGEAGPLGEVVSVAQDDRGVRVLAVLPTDAPRTGLRAGDALLSPMKLLDGPAR